MTEQTPSASAQALLSEILGSCGRSGICRLQTPPCACAESIDRYAERVCEQRVSAETERCARYHDERGRLVSRSSAYQQAWHEMAARDLRAPAERPAPDPLEQARQKGFEQGIAAAAEYVAARPNEQPAVLAGLMRDLGSMYAAERPAPEGPQPDQAPTVAEDFIQQAYKKTNGPTAGLRRVYRAYIDNERRRESAKTDGRPAPEGPQPAAVVDYTERARELLRKLHCWRLLYHDARPIDDPDVGLVADALSAVASERDAAAIRAFGQRVWSDSEEVAYQAGVSDTLARLREPDEELIEAAEKAYRGDGWKSSMRAALTKIAEMLK